MITIMCIEGSHCGSYLQIFHFFQYSPYQQKQNRTKLEKEKNKLIIFYWYRQHQDFQRGTFGLLSVQVYMVEAEDRQATQHFASFSMAQCCRLVEHNLSPSL